MHRRLALAGGGLAATGIAGYYTTMLAPSRPLHLTQNGPMGSAVRKQPADLAEGKRVAKERFHQGAWWEWVYKDGSGNVQAFERYSVRDVLGDECLIDMASKMDEAGQYQVHHRMHVSLGEALAAKDTNKQWTFRKFGFFRDGRWLEAPFKDNVQAFEEKFDGFLMAAPSAAPMRAQRSRLLDIAALGQATLVRSARHAYTGSWYVSEPSQHAGLAAFKTFGREGAPDTYTFELVGMGTDHVDHDGDFGATGPLLSRTRELAG